MWGPHVKSTSLLSLPSSCASVQGGAAADHAAVSPAPTGMLSGRRTTHAVATACTAGVERRRSAPQQLLLHERPRSPCGVRVASELARGGSYVPVRSGATSRPGRSAGRWQAGELELATAAAVYSGHAHSSHPCTTATTVRSGHVLFPIRERPLSPSAQAVALVPVRSCAGHCGPIGDMRRCSMSHAEDVLPPPMGLTKMLLKRREER